jgi:hypothetical protein
MAFNWQNRRKTKPAEAARSVQRGNIHGSLLRRDKL